MDEYSKMSSEKLTKFINSYNSETSVDTVESGFCKASTLCIVMLIRKFKVTIIMIRTSTNPTNRVSIFRGRFDVLHMQRQLFKGCSLGYSTTCSIIHLLQIYIKNYIKY